LNDKDLLFGSPKGEHSNFSLMLGSNTNFKFLIYEDSQIA